MTIVLTLFVAIGADRSPYLRLVDTERSTTNRRDNVIDRGVCSYGKMPTKVARLIDRYGLDGYGEELERRWTGDGYDRESLRDLADRFNRQVLEAKMREAGMNPLAGEVDNMYDLLTDDTVSVGVQTEARRRLERAGVDIEELRSEFVSHQAVHTYLRETRGASRSRNEESPEEKLERGQETIQRLASRVEAVTGNTVDRLDAAGVITLSDPAVLVEITVLCEACGTQYEISELLEGRHCACAEEN